MCVPEIIGGNRLVLYIKCDKPRLSRDFVFPFKVENNLPKIE